MKTKKEHNAVAELALHKYLKSNPLTSPFGNKGEYEFYKGAVAFRVLIFLLSRINFAWKNIEKNIELDEVIKILQKRLKVKKTSKTDSSYVYRVYKVWEKVLFNVLDKKEIITSGGYKKHLIKKLHLKIKSFNYFKKLS